VTTPEYENLLARVDVTGAEIAKRRAADLECRKGCTMCCNVQLALSPVEADSVRLTLAALDTGARERIRARAEALPDDAPHEATCVMLEEDGACAIYSARPIVCRTQGHALLHRKGPLPAGAIYGTAKHGDITWCPLNYTEGKPKSEDVLQAGIVDAALAQVNQRADEARALERTAMSDLALEGGK
jgi:Fe-S-cluster containining protein